MKNYTEYSRLPSYMFNVENSIRNLHMKIIDYEEATTSKGNWLVKCYTLNPPFETHYPSVAILFEHRETFDSVWCHYPLVYFKEDKVKPHKINIEDVRSRKT